MAQFILYSSSTSRYYMSVPEYFEEKKLEITKLFCFLSCRMRGTHAAVGVATRTAPIHVHGYKSLIGNLMITSR